MEFTFSAARWVVSKALAPVADGLLEAWAASKNLGAETDAITAELLYAQAMLNNTRGREIDNQALNELLLKLRLLAYDADDVLDELDYFSIQDELDGTYHAADAHAGGCAHDLLLNARHTARYVANKFKPSSGWHGASPNMPGPGHLCGVWPSKKIEKGNDRHYYVIHDLLHELAVKVSRYDCLTIPTSKVRYIQIPASVRHLSITVDNKDVEDRITFEDRAKDLGGLDKILQIENLRTLMIFGENMGSFSTTFDIINMGNLKHLRELWRFNTEKEKNGFELSQLARLLELEVLGIYNLEKVEAKEAVALKLLQKNQLRELILDWDINRSEKDPIREKNILENLRPHSNLYRLSITGHGAVIPKAPIDICAYVRKVNRIRCCGPAEEALSGPPSSSANKVEETRVIAQHEQQQQQDERTEGEIATMSTTSEGLLLLPSQLQELLIWDCENLVLCPGLLDDDKHLVQTGGGGALQFLCSLRSLEIDGCPRFFSYSSFSYHCFPFPSSLERLYLDGVEGTKTMLPLSNLTSLTDLSIRDCGDLRGEGLWPLLAQGCLTKLTVFRTPNFFAGSEPSLPHEQEFPSSSPKLQELETDDVVGVLAAPTCAFLSSLLTELHFWLGKEVERFTKEQEVALQLLTSLEDIRFWVCDKLQCLPVGLHRLPNLKRLGIEYCAAIRFLPKDGLPGSSLQELVINNCPAIRSLPKDCLPGSLQKLVIRRCPAIRPLPKVDDLPSSLRELDVCDGNSEELRRQCRKLIGTIPIVRA
ncbi:hypothetical protein HU200_065320 [Digitaria exilis]|uniref:Rx N-terminal domain-containing protein n=1 Tax=Digitaria exilis TaxID=1010633 RepID=A0A835DXN3_9POAL|nr:hypothetical protein HU200_065320 [Digitaria exilis]